MAKKSASVHRRGEFSPKSVAEAAAELKSTLDQPAQMAFAFVSADYLPHLEEFSEIVRVDGRVTELAGATGWGIITDGVEMEEQSGFCLLALADPKTQFEPSVITQQSPGSASIHGTGLAPESSIVLANPFVLDVETWLAGWNSAWPGVPCIGGLASASGQPDDCAVFYNGRVVEGLAVKISGGLKVQPMVSQGCRPIGEPLTVTRAESNVVYSLGARPAYEALESAFETLADNEKATARGNLFAGLAGNEYVEDFKSGDFLIRNIIGADPQTGAVVIGGIPRIGQTLQYQLRDRRSADSELRAVMRAAAAECGRPLASLVFACTGRGTRLFGSKSHDATLMESAFGVHPVAGLFCNGEIAPLGGKSYIHSYTLSCALFVDGYGVV